MKDTNLTAYQQLVNVPQTLSTILKLAFAGLIISGIIWSRDGIGVAGKVLFGSAIVVLFLMALNKSGLHRATGMFLLMLIIGIVTFLAIREDGFYNAPIMAYPILIIITGLLFGRRTVPKITLTLGLLIVLMFILDRLGILNPFNGAIIFWTGDLFIALTILFATGTVLSLLMGIIESNLDKIIEAEEQIQNTYNQTLMGWAKALELRGREPEGHHLRLLDIVNQVTQSMVLEDEIVENLRRGALLHDIGKMGIPDEILLKPGPLTEEEFDFVQQHTLMAKHVIGNDPYLAQTLNVALYHHEKWDGSGYPEGLHAEEIPLLARIFSLIDNWDALTTPQVYRDAWSKEETIAYFKQEAGTKFDVALVNQFVQLLETD